MMRSSKFLGSLLNNVIVNSAIKTNSVVIHGFISSRITQPASSRNYSITLDNAVPISESVIKNYLNYFPKFVNYVLEDEVFESVSPFDKDWLKEMLEYNVPYGYRRTPYFALSAYHAMEKPEKMTEEKIEKMNLITWCIHMAQWSYQMIDDITDESDIRDNKPCWYRREDIGLNAINDGTLLSSIPPILLKRHFSDHKYYHELLELFNYVTLFTMFGQRLDCTKCPWPQMTIDRWENTVFYKTVWHQNIISFKTALYMADHFQAEQYKRMEPILLNFAILNQMRNDFLDGFPIDGLAGVNSTDIQEGKCSWLLVHALQLCNPTQKLTIEENFGVRDESRIKKVHDIYVELGMEEYGEKFRNQLYNDILKQIDDLPKDYPKQALKNGLMIGYQGY